MSDIGGRSPSLCFWWKFLYTYITLAFVVNLEMPCIFILLLFLLNNKFVIAWCVSRERYLTFYCFNLLLYFARVALGFQWSHFFRHHETTPLTLNVCSLRFLNLEQWLECELDAFFSMNLQVTLHFCLSLQLFLSWGCDVFHPYFFPLLSSLKKQWFLGHGMPFPYPCIFFPVAFPSEFLG